MVLVLQASMADKRNPFKIAVISGMSTGDETD